LAEAGENVQDIVLEMKDITKRFFSVLALEKVSLIDPASIY
jgi:ABC-type sugar transport system ATPase subunit